MSTPPKPPERIAEILMEIVALSNSTRTSESECASDSDSSELFDAHRVEEQPQRRDQEDNNGQRP